MNDKQRKQHQMYMYMVKVIKSCETVDQLYVTQQWVDRVIKANESNFLDLVEKHYFRKTLLNEIEIMRYK